MAFSRIDRLLTGRFAGADLAGCRRGELGDAGAEDEPSLHVPREHPVVLERDRDPVRGGSRQPGGRDQLGEGGAPAFHRGEHRNGLVQYPDAARVVHVLIPPSQSVKSGAS